jgi:hypothetical protein
MVPVRPGDRVRIERRIVLDGALLGKQRCRLGHEGILGTRSGRVKPVPSGRDHMLPAMERPSGRRRMSFPGAGELSGMGGRLTFLFGILLAMSALTGWYSGEGNGTTVSVIGWHTGTIGKLVFFTGLAVLVLLLLRATGLDLPPVFPVGAAVASLGALGTILVLVRLIDIPDSFVGAGRGIGIWISFVAGLAVVGAGLLEASEEVDRPA